METVINGISLPLTVSEYLALDVAVKDELLAEQVMSWQLVSTKKGRIWCPLETEKPEQWANEYGTRNFSTSLDASSRLLDQLLYLKPLIHGQPGSGWLIRLVNANGDGYSEERASNLKEFPTLIGLVALKALGVINK